MFINGIGSISAHRFNVRQHFFDTVEPNNNLFHVQEPNYENIFTPNILRRTSKVVRIGVAAALQCLTDADVAIPNLITIGTGYGCLTDTESFLQKMILQEEKMLTPTAFIQSTHNTVSGQIALHLACTAPNFTFVHKAHSFESSLIHARLHLMENSLDTVLAGGVDEITAHTEKILRRFKNEKLLGEGSNFILLGNKINEDAYAEIVDVVINTGEQNVEEEAMKLCLKNGIQRKDLEFIFTNTPSVFLDKQHCINFELMSGEYPTNTAFALNISIYYLLQSIKNKPEEIHWCLIHKTYKNDYHSFILIKSISL